MNLNYNGFYFEPNQTALDFGYIKQKEVGVSAQQVQAILPEAVSGDEKLSVNYMDVHTLKIAALEKRIAELEAKLNK